MKLETGNAIVDAVGKMHFQGNIIHDNWYNYVKMDNGKTDALGLLLLAEIVFWYRPRTDKDEITGNITNYKKRFRSDLLQKSYSDLAERFNFSKRQVKDALTRLENLGVITKHFRTIITADKMKVGNVLFIELHPGRLHDITYGLGGYDVKTSEGVLQKNVIGVNKERQTNTQSTQRVKEVVKAQASNEEINAFKELEKLNIRLSFMQIDDYNFYSEIFPQEVIVAAIEIAAKKQKTHWGYIAGILKQWQDKGIKTLEDVKALEQKETVPPKAKESSRNKLAAMTEKLLKEGRL